MPCRGIFSSLEPTPRIAAMKHIIVGTAGHIDHGKTALVKALTGTDTDRLKEEQQRGITIDLGFAFLPLAKNIELGIVDVPGHEKFVKNMLAGIGGIDLAIFVIAADEGIMPQTEEHLDICNLLQIQRGLVAITKTDLVEDEWLEMVIEDVHDRLDGTFLEEAPIIPVSSKTGAGLESLRKELEMLAAQVEERGSEGIFRLPVDRVFTIKGFGTVVTGTMISGSVKGEDIVEILPEGSRTRVRNVQVHDAPVELAYAGQRTALNLHGMEKKAIQRGAVVCEPDRLCPTYMLDAHLTLTPRAPKSLKYRTRVRFHHGTNEVLARVVLFDRDELLPGDNAYVQFRLETPLIAMARDRYIIRSYSPIITIGGGEILFTQPQKHKQSSQIAAPSLRTLKEGSLEDVLSYYVEQARLQPITSRKIAGMLAVTEAEIQQGLQHLIRRKKIINTAEQGIAAVHVSHYTTIVEHLLRVLDEFHTQFPLKPGMVKEELRKKLSADLPPQVFQHIMNDQVNAGMICLEQQIIRKSTYRLQLSAGQEHIKQKLAQLYHSGRFQPPNRKAALKNTGFPEKESQKIFNVLIHDGTLVRVEEELYYHKNILAEMTQRIRAYLQEHHEMTIGDVKTLFQISRKYTVPFMAHLDATGITIRKGDTRVLRIDD